MPDEPNIDEAADPGEADGSVPTHSTDVADTDGGEDESSAPQNGNDDHLKEDQKPTTK